MSHLAGNANGRNGTSETDVLAKFLTVSTHIAADASAGLTGSYGR